MDGAEASAGVTKAQENRPLFERFGDAVFLSPPVNP